MKNKLRSINYFILGKTTNFTSSNGNCFEFSKSTLVKVISPEIKTSPDLSGLDSAYSFNSTASG